VTSSLRAWLLHSVSGLQLLYKLGSQRAYQLQQGAMVVLNFKGALKRNRKMKSYVGFETFYTY